MSVLVTDGINPAQIAPGVQQFIRRSAWLPFGLPQGGTSAGIFGANQVRFFGVENQFFRELSSVLFTAGSAGGVGALLTFGIFDLNGNKLTSNNLNPLDGTLTTAQSKALDTPIILSPGFYLIAYTSNDGTIGMQNLSVSSAAFINTAKQSRMGTFVNASAGGLLPATAGGLTPIGLGNIALHAFE
jgi:hypothetical protein